jgi:hypothetical protein
LLTFLFKVEFVLNMPLSVKDKVTEEDVANEIKNTLSEMNVIGDIKYDETDVLVKGKIKTS